MKSKSETVYVARIYLSGPQKTYHTDKDCQNLQRSDNITEKQKHLLHDDMVLCSICNDSINHCDQNRNCPYCGEVVGKLPPHLVKCPEK